LTLTSSPMLNLCSMLPPVVVVSVHQSAETVCVLRLRVEDHRVPEGIPSRLFHLELYQGTHLVRNSTRGLDMDSIVHEVDDVGLRVLRLEPADHSSQSV